MVYQTLVDFNRSGVEGLFLYVAEVVPPFIPMLFVATYLIIFFGIYVIQKNFGSAMAVAGIITLIAAFMLSMVEGLVPGIVLIPIFVVAVIGIVVLFTTGRE